MVVFCLTTASGTTDLLDYIASIIWNIDYDDWNSSNDKPSHYRFVWLLTPISNLHVHSKLIHFCANRSRLLLDSTVCCQCGPAESRHYHCCRRRRCDFVATCVVFCSGGAWPRRRRRRRNPATAADVGGASYHLRPLGCGLAHRRRDGCPVAPTCWVMHWHNKHPCNPNSVPLHFKRDSAAGRSAWRRLLSSNKTYDRNKLSYIIHMSRHFWWHMTGICLYVPSIWHHVVSSDMTGIWRSYDNLCHIPVIYLSYICHIPRSVLDCHMTWYDSHMITIYLKYINYGDSRWDIGTSNFVPDIDPDIGYKVYDIGNLLTRYRVLGYPISVLISAVIWNPDPFLILRYT